MKVVYCNIQSWKDCVPTAEHYYVRMEVRGESHTTSIRRKLTLSEADRLNRRYCPLTIGSEWKAGEETTQFFSRDRAIKSAIEQYKTLFPGAIILVEGDKGTYEPQTILDGPPEAMEAINELVKQAEAIDWWEEDEAAMKVISDKWKAIWIPEFEEE